MPASCSVLYPVGTKFDMDYYLTKHMPMVMEKWAPYGLLSWKVAEVGHGLNDSLELDSTKSAYSVHAILEWKDLESVAAAAKTEPESKVFADVPNFSDKAPIFFTGKIVGSS